MVSCTNYSECYTTGGYKGYGLGMMVEVFCGLLSGASFGPNVRRWKTNDRPANLVINNLFSGLLSRVTFMGYLDVLWSVVWDYLQF